MTAIFIKSYAKDFKWLNYCLKSIAKYVNPDFRQKVNNSHGNWISKKIETNKLKEK